MLLLSVLFTQAQQMDTLVNIRDVVISSSRFDQFNTGSKTRQPDSVAAITYRTQTLAELLGAQSQVYIKSYGQGSLATSSFRGAAAEHTAVLWKGFNLQSPLYGQVDLSLINSDAAENVSIQYGGNGALFGSGAVGGTIQLQSAAHYNSGLHASAGVQFGNYGHLRKQAGLSYGGKKWYNTTKWFQFDVDNDFEFNNVYLAGKPKMKQNNAHVAQQGLLNEFYINLTSAQQLNVNLWYHYAYTQIPPAMSVQQYNGFQLDENYRATAEWKMQQNNVTYMARTAYFDQSVDYIDPVDTALNGDSRAISSISELETRIKLHAKHFLNIGLNNTYVNAYSKNYKGWFDQNRIALFASYKMQDVIKKITTTVSIREEKIADTYAPVMPSFGVEWRVATGVKVFGNISRSYRVPTFNERYWITGVNRNLRPESGWGEELSIAVVKPLFKSRSMLDITLTGFSRNMQDWIIWLPSGGMEWSPQNLKKVWSRGAEAEIGLKIPFRKWQLRYHATFNYVVSTNTETGFANDGALDKQLIYVPRVTQQQQLFATFSSYHIGYLHTYTGLSYTATDNSKWLNDYVLGAITAGKEFKWKKYSLVLTAQVNNVFDVTYQAVADRPMPGRNYITAITIKL
jgi:vitamin B12 transporter